MTADRWTQAVRQQLGLGRLLPLGGAGDGAWITEAAAVSVLRHGVRQVPYVRLGPVRLELVDPDRAAEPAVPPPPSALPPGPLRVTAGFAASPAEPLPVTASRLREAFTRTATRTLGLRVTEVDLRVTGLLEEDPGTADRDGGDGDGAGGHPHAAEPRPDGLGPADLRLDGEEARVAAAVRSVPGVTRLDAVHLTHPEGASGAPALPRRHVRVEIGATTAVRTLDLAEAVRKNVTAALPDHPSAAVLVTALTPL
ncbi:nucleopolyhedrovirus P10 family protein [Streptomyces apricus]|uniref:Nucleopolyhedrovirus P10 family protein n=1 Tax=Streptomyces apricus TaxID=1828112 RepID=A0A5B0APB5_9ACTN|nr:nucleopolyhedrovirus P10 family protein [Streptomyces apricus]KAA0931527.1 nucleopolyhedrovirus P10 family protein [Streptomyces apricus]